MKIVFFTSGLSGGGAERVCCNLANFLCQREHDIEFITISDDEATYPLSTKISRPSTLAPARTEQLPARQSASFLQSMQAHPQNPMRLLYSYVADTDNPAIITSIPHQSQNYRFGACRSLHVPSFETKAIEESCP